MSAPAPSSSSSSSSSNAAPPPVTISLSLSNVECSFRFESYPLSLRSSFGTSHSASTTRNNVLLTLELTAACEVVIEEKETEKEEGAALTVTTGEEVIEPVLEYTMLQGYSEVGLPPLKVGCYEADYERLKQRLEQFIEHAMEQEETIEENQAAGEEQLLYDPFAALPRQYFTKIRTELAVANTEDGLDEFLAASPSFTSLTTTISSLFRLLDSFIASSTPQPVDAAFGCMIENALLDAWGRLRKELVCDMITSGRGFDAEEEDDDEEEEEDSEEKKAAPAGPSAFRRAHPQPRSFYTVGMDSLPVMWSNLAFGLGYTNLIKVKVNEDVAHTKLVLDAIVERMQKVCGSEVDAFRISIDANASWSTPQVAREYLSILTPHKQWIAMVEQPFPLFRAKPKYIEFDENVSSSSPSSPSSSSTLTQVVDGKYVPLSSSTFSAWTEVVAEYKSAGLLIYADESICSMSDYTALRPLLHGVNLKLEKTGGVREALTLIHAADNEHVKVWIGCMVGSSLNSTAAAMLLPATRERWGDLDGSLLTSEDSQLFSGGMQWHKIDKEKGEKPNGEIRIVDLEGEGGTGASRK